MKKFHLSCIAILIVSLSIITIYKNKPTKNTLLTSNNKTSVNKITAIEFPQPGGDIPNKVNFSLESNLAVCDNKIKSNLTNKMEKAIKYKKLPNIADRITKLKKSFSINKVVKDTKDTANKNTIIESTNSFIKIQDDGTFDYHLKNKDTLNNNQLTDSNASKIAETFLKNNELLPNDYYFTTVGYEKTTPIGKNGIGTSKILRKFVYFNRKIDGKITNGISRIVVGVGQNGEIDDVYYDAKDLSNSVNVNIKNFNTAYADLKKLNNGMFSIESDVTTVKINNVELTYWDDCSPNSNQDYIQPVYKFSGNAYNKSGEKSDFHGIVSAIPESETIK